MQVVEDHHDGTTPRHPLEQGHQPGPDLRDAIRPVLARLLPQSEHQPELGGDAFGLGRVVATSLDQVVELLGHDVARRAALHAELAPEDLGERAERALVLGPARNAGHDLDLLRQRGQELVGQPGLADAGLAEHCCVWV